MSVLTGKRVLLVEDEALIAMAVSDMLEGMGMVVDGPYRSVVDARGAIEREKPELALLDVDLGSHSSVELADELRAIGVPLMFVTGFGSRWSEEAKGAPVIAKPFSEAVLFDRLQELVTS